ncbi:MAG: hypothetical protein NTU73_15005 [Ignavibacteriae bacterium]|nr:hypothetical protein [Ignavibacteriota bacterium]
MNFIFDIVAGGLNLIANKTGLTYEEINIIVYYFIIPFTYFILIDKYFKRHYFKIIFVIFSIIFFISIRSFKNYSEWLFERSAQLLNSFNFLGLNYTYASVVICVFIVIIIYTVLITAIIMKKRKEKIV